MIEKPTKIDPVTGETLYPCADCEVMRTKAEGGTVFTVCDACWDRHHTARDREALDLTGRLHIEAAAR